MWTCCVCRRLGRPGAGAQKFGDDKLRIGVHKIDRELPLEIAALFGCAVMTGVGAVVNTAQVRPGQSVAVVGLAAWACRR